MKTNRTQLACFLNIPFHEATAAWAVVATLAIAITVIMIAALPAQAQTFQVIHNFTGQGQDGGNPQQGLVMDRGGNLYGTTRNGGTGSCSEDGIYGCGTVFKMKNSGTGWYYEPLYSFVGPNNNDGAYPQYGSMVIGADGSLYGHTSQGGVNISCSGSINGCGTVYNLKPPPTRPDAVFTPWREKVIYAFGSRYDGHFPAGNLVFDAAGNLYGGAEDGGPDDEGLIFALTPSDGSWTKSVVHGFPAFEGDGEVPFSGVSLDSGGNLWGTAWAGGSQYWGTAFEFTPSGSGWTYNTVHEFNDATGWKPMAGVVEDGSGNIFGATSDGNNYTPVLFELSPYNGSWTYTILYSWDGFSAYGPAASMVMDSAGNLYGTAQGSLTGFGTVFELSPYLGTWVYTTLHTFSGGEDGRWPFSNVVIDAQGNLYGTASQGGASQLLSARLWRGVGDHAVKRLSAVSREVARKCGAGANKSRGKFDRSQKENMMMRTKQRNIRPFGATDVWMTLAAATIAAVMVIAGTSAHAQTFQVLHTFTGAGDGKYPSGGGITMDRFGNLYGGTSYGGQYTNNCDYYGTQTGCGVVFKMSHRASGWTFDVLHSFNGSDGYSPNQLISVAADGSIYGSTYYGGTGTFCTSGCGTLFHLQPPASFCRSVSCPWNATVIHDMQGEPNDGSLPNFGALTVDAAGNIYSTSETGGLYNGGAVYELVRSGNTWSPKVLYSFTGYLDGANPWGGVIIDQSGNIFGTATSAFDGAGVVFELTPAGPGYTYHVLHTFNGGTDGGIPSGPLAMDPSGNLFGVTESEGPNGGGTVWELSPNNGGWNFSLVYSFTDGPFSGPVGGLLLDTAGNLYGATIYNGAYNYGSVFKLTPSGNGWTYTSLHDFTGGSDGWYPWSSLSMDATGNLYGVAAFGGNSQNCQGGCGVVFEITP